LPFKSRLYQLWVKLSGAPASFSLNARILHSVCIICIVALCYNIPFNYLIGLKEVAFVSSLVLVIIIGAYYVSRFLKWVNFGSSVVNFTAILLAIVMYFLNSGIAGPNDLFTMLFLLLSIGISSSHQYKFWVPVNLFVYLALITYEYYHPEMVRDLYPNRSTRFIDHSSAYIVIGAMTYVCIAYIRNSYEKEKQAVTEKAAAIEEKNRQIIQQNQELEQLNAEKNKLMSIVAHDLRSPLANIQSFLELLTQDVLDADERMAIELKLLSSTNNTLDLLSKLLSWSKTQMQGITAQPEYLKLSILLESTICLERQLAEQKDLRIEHQVDPSTVIYADSDMMQLVLRNIVGNAVKFTESGGHILIRSNVSDSDCIISIKDNGIGIPAIKQSSIFSLNVQSTFGTKNEQGVGLGLMLCKEYIHAQNGKIWFESQPGFGTTFYLSIPVSDDLQNWPLGLS
jgi:two-component system sensor histidine kinase/response regulator